MKPLTDYRTLIDYVLDEKRREQKGRWSSLVLGFVLFLAGLVGVSRVFKIEKGNLDAFGTLAMIVLGVSLLNQALLGFRTHTEKNLLWELCEREKARIENENNQPVQTTAMTHPPSTTAQAPLSDL